MLPRAQNCQGCGCALLSPQVLTETSRTLLRQIIEDAGWGAWSGVESDERGRPILRNLKYVDVSVSYSKDWILVAAARGCRVGVDVESVTPVFDRPALARRACTKAEALDLQVLSLERRRSALADLWTAKEAAVKADGAGLSIDFRTLESSQIPVMRLSKGESGLSACIVRKPMACVADSASSPMLRWHAFSERVHD